MLSDGVDVVDPCACHGCGKHRRLPRATPPTRRAGAFGAGVPAAGARRSRRRLPNRRSERFTTTQEVRMVHSLRKTRAAAFATAAALSAVSSACTGVAGVPMPAAATAAPATMFLAELSYNVGDHGTADQRVSSFHQGLRRRHRILPAPARMRRCGRGVRWCRRQGACVARHRVGNAGRSRRMP